MAFDPDAQVLAERAILLNRAWRFSPEAYRSPNDIDDTASFLRMITDANGAPCVCNGTYDVRDLALGDLPHNIEGQGSLLHSVGFGIINVSRTPGPAIAISSIAFRNFAASTSDGNAWNATALAVGSVAGIKTGDIFGLSSQDPYPWSQDAWPDATNPKVFQSNLIEILGIGLDFNAGASTYVERDSSNNIIGTYSFAEGETVTGQTSGATGVVRSRGLGVTGTLVFTSIAGSFVSGETLTVGGVARATTASVPMLLTSERLEYNFATLPTLRKMPVAKSRIALTIEAVGDIDSRVGAANRKPAIVLEGVYQPDLDIVVRSAWTRAILRRSCYKGRVRAHIMRLPNDADTNESAYGYGVELAGADYGAEVIVSGGNCRHMFTTNTYLTSAYQNISLWWHGTVKHPVVRGTGKNCFNAAFDTHAGSINVTFMGCAAFTPNHAGRSITGSICFQNRGYGTRHIGCIATGGIFGFVEQSLGQTAGFPHVNEVISCVSDDYREVGFLNSSAASKNFGRLSYVDITSRGDGTAGGVLVQSGLQSTNSARVSVIGAVLRRFNNTAMRFNGGDITIDGIMMDFTELGTTQVSGIRFDGASTISLGKISYTPGTATAQPKAVFRWNNVANITMYKFGAIRSTNAINPPLMENSSTGIATVTDTPEATGVAT